ncbi:unnamed protein product [Vitrella brassicaformis CCMP3155]|uniref:H15 domain-containing protein n=1 Tax=Vitrella brassicaformis (strain CCMP3155) TaxID=1169540 RepID=A0A0G4EDX3_VITBC|nr:unnamed protein product [Vitrella brassicaformis CCMP3155]|eukprot:CEL93949.1 unnamed protein product [Vitrella brassicaformis CCMP3155]
MAQPQSEAKASVDAGESATTSQQQQPSGPLAMATAAAVGTTGNGNGNGRYVSVGEGRVYGQREWKLITPWLKVGDKVSVLNANPLYVEAECVEGDRKGVTGKFMPKCVNFDNTFVDVAEAGAAPKAKAKGKGEAKSGGGKAGAAPKHPSFEEMIKEAIGTLKDQSGSSLFAIKKFIQAKYSLDVEDARTKHHLSRSLYKPRNSSWYIKASYKLNMNVGCQDWPPLRSDASCLPAFYSLTG